MKLYIFRHAQKETDFSGDPDLTPEGHAQASKLLEKVLKNELPTPTQLWVSPKKRTHSTFRPLSEHLDLPMQSFTELREQLMDENMIIFRKRVEAFIEGAAKAGGKNDVIYMCSHYDWVIEAMSLVPSDTDLTDDQYSHWSPAQHAGFEVGEDGLFKFIEFKRLTV